MQNQWKLLSQLKDYLNKANDKNQQIIVSKDWLDSLQKLTYSQLETIRKLSSSEAVKTTDTSKSPNTKHKDSNDLENVNLTLVSEQTESLPNHDSTMQPKTQQVIIYILNEAKYFYLIFVQKVNFCAANSWARYAWQQNWLQRIKRWHDYATNSTLFLKLSPKTTQSTIIVPKWKVNIHSNIPKHSIVSRTRHVLNSIVSAESNASKLRRLEELLLHVDQYPEARHYAIKEGAIRVLLRTRQKTNDEQIKGICRKI